MISLKRLDIITVCETWLKPHKKFRLPHYNILRLDRPTEGGGILIAIKQDINISNFKYISSYDNKFQAIQIDIHNITLISIYNTNDHYISETFWDNNFVINNDKHYIILGDFNLGILPDDIQTGHHPFQFIKSLSRKNITLLNTDQATRLGQIHQRNTSPDLTFISTKLFPYSEWI